MSTTKLQIQIVCQDVSLLCECVRDYILCFTCSTRLLPFPRVFKRTFPSVRCQMIFGKLSQVLLYLFLVVLASFITLLFHIKTKLIVRKKSNIPMLIQRKHSLDYLKSQS